MTATRRLAAILAGERVGARPGVPRALPLRMPSVGFAVLFGSGVDRVMARSARARDKTARTVCIEKADRG